MKTPQEIRESILDLLKKRSTSANKMLIECGYNTNLINDLGKGQMPSADKIAKMAKYLGVSTDFLMGNYGGDEPDLDEDLIAGLRRILNGTSAKKLSERDKKHILELSEMLRRIKNRENEE